MKNTISKYKNIKRRLVIDGILVGIMAGFFSLLYRYILSKLDVLRNYLYSSQTSLNILLVTLLGVILALIVGRLIIYEPLASGSGIPQVQGEVLGYFNMNPIKVLVTKILGGSLNNLIGLSLGREGPSIQIGAAAGKITSKLLKRDLTEEKYLITAGASAGLSAAFNAPLAGALFSLEEVHKNFSSLLLIPSIIAAVIADFLAKYVFGLNPVFSFKVVEVLKLKDYYIVIIIGLITGIVGIIFNKSILKGQDLYNKSNIQKQYRPLIPILTSVLLGFTFSHVQGGGHHLIEEVASHNFPILMLITFLVVKLLFTSLSFGSSVQGGIFLPVLVLGGLTGTIIFRLFLDLNIISMDLLPNFLIFSMAGILTSVVRAPILSIILVTEMTGSFSHLLSITVASIVAYLIAESLKQEPIYESLLKRQIINYKNVKDEKGNLINEASSEEKIKNKVINTFTLPLSSSYVDRKIKDMDLPKGTLIISIIRGGKELIPKGETILKAGDSITLFMEEDNISLNKKLYM